MLFTCYIVILISLAALVLLHPVQVFEVGQSTMGYLVHTFLRSIFPTGGSCLTAHQSVCVIPDLNSISKQDNLHLERGMLSTVK